MKRTLFAATLLTSAALIALPAQALEVTVGGEGEVDVTISAGANVDATVEMGAAAGAGSDAEAAGGGEITADGMLTLRGDGDTEATVAVDTLIGQAVYTSDGVEFGTVAEVAADAEGKAVFTVDVVEGWIEGIASVAIYATAVVQADGQLQVEATEEELRASIAAGLAAEAGAAAGG